MKTIIAAAMAILPLLSPAASAEQPTPAEVYQSRYFLYGAYVRAGSVCEYQPFVSYGMGWVASKEMQMMSASFKDVTTEWAMDGAKDFNTRVMANGLVPACAYMVKLMNGGEKKKSADLQS